MSDNNKAETFLEEYGNNFFELACVYHDDEGQHTDVIQGVLTDIPSFSQTAKWEDGPAASFTNFINETLNNEFVEYLAMGSKNSNGEYDYERFIGTDDKSSREYAGTDFWSFDLKFRVYTGQKIGAHSLSSAKAVMEFLSSRTLPYSRNNEIDIKKAFRNIEAAAKGLSNVVRNYASGHQDRTQELTTVEEMRAHMKSEYVSAAANGVNRSINFEADSERMVKNSADRMNAINNSEVYLNKGNNAGIIGTPICLLKILPTFFKQSIPVIITNVSITTSKEYNEAQKDHFYYEFSVSCNCPQIFSWGECKKRVVKAGSLEN